MKLSERFQVISALLASSVVSVIVAPVEVILVIVTLKIVGARVSETGGVYPTLLDEPKVQPFAFPEL